LMTALKESLAKQGKSVGAAKPKKLRKSA
jgi:hypothetical protein